MGQRGLGSWTTWLALAGGAMVGCWSLTADLDLARGGEGGGGDDAGGDASPEAGASPCAALADSVRLCDDFDVGPLGARWTRVSSAGSGVPELGSAFVASPPFSFVARAPGDCSADDSAQLIDEAPGQPAEASVELDLSIAKIGSSPGFNLVGIVYDVSEGVYRTDLAFRDGRLEVTEGPPYGLVARSGQGFPADVFARVGVTFTFVGSPRVVVQVNGVTQIEHAIRAPAPAGALTKLDVGIYTGAPCQGLPVEARIDNLVYRLRTR